MAINKVIYGNNTLIDLTDLDVTAGDVVSGVTFIMNDGTKAVGNITIPTKVSDLTDDVGLITSTNWLDMFYPVGSYYETSDTLFNPNTSWGGTWVLETAGMVHVSGGTGYSVSKANNNSGAGAKDGGSADAVVVSHSHTEGTLSGSTPTLTASGSNFITSATAVSSLRGTITSSSSSSYNYVRVETSSASMSRSAPSIASGKTVTISGSTDTEGVSGTGANMQPYINVNRWHRTA